MLPISDNDALLTCRHCSTRWAAPIPRALFGQQAGSALVICLLVLAAVTVLGVSGINSSAVQLQIAANHKQMGHGFYLAEGAAMEGVQRLTNAPHVDLLDRINFWHHARKEIVTPQTGSGKAQQLPLPGSTSMPALPSSLGPNNYLAAVEWGPAPGSSLVVTEPRLYLNRVYGKASRNHVDSIIEIGLQKRY